MKRFIKNIIIFGVALFGFLIVCDAITTYAFHQKNTRKYAIWNDILHTDIDAEVLIMGNSRAWCMYSPAILDSILETNTYNIGFDGSCFDRQAARYDIYRHYQKAKPKCIIQNVEYFTLGKTEGYEREQFMPYMMYPYFRKRIQGAESFSFGELYIPMYRYYVNNFYEDYNKFDYVVNKGYYAREIGWDGSKLDDTEPYIQNVDSNSLHLFVDYIEHTKQEGIALVLVIAPSLKEVSKVVLNMDEIHQLFYDLSKKYDIPLLDYSDSYISQDTIYFYNASHLNKEGAELFSIQLAHDIDSLNLINSLTHQLINALTH